MVVEVDGRPSVIEMTIPSILPAGFNISNSGKPDDDLVCRALAFLLGKCLRKEAKGLS